MSRGTVSNLTLGMTTGTITTILKLLDGIPKINRVTDIAIVHHVTLSEDTTRGIKLRLETSTNPERVIEIVSRDHGTDGGQRGGGNDDQGDDRSNEKTHLVAFLQGRITVGVDRVV